jgi:hypothetical protein
MTSTQEPMTLSTIEQTLEMDRLWRKGFKEEDRSSMIKFTSLYARCNEDAKKAMNTIREQDLNVKYWEKIASRVNAVSALKAKNKFRKGQVFYYGSLRPAN